MSALSGGQAEQAVTLTTTGWTRVRPGEYRRADGVTIRKDQDIRDWWTIHLPNGQAPGMPLGDGEWATHLPACAMSLSAAQWMAERVTADSPVFAGWPT